MHTHMRQFKVDYELLHEYIKAIGFKHKYEKIFLVEPINHSQFVIRLKFPHSLETYPIYVNHVVWESFLEWRKTQKS